MDQRRLERRRAARRERAGDAAAGLVRFQTRLPANLAERLRAALQHPEARQLLTATLERELIDVTQFPLLQSLSVEVSHDFVTRRQAHALYRSNRVRVDALSPGSDERLLAEGLDAEFAEG
jgi:hypothetical protein